MESMGIGVIGCGSMGRAVVNGVIQCDERLKVVALHDPDERSIRAAQQMVGGSPVVCSSYEDLVSLPEVDWVMIASWNCHHSEQTVAAFEAGKHVFCQKPLALSLEECLAMKRAWEKSGKLFNLGFNLRYSPHYRKLKQLVSEGRIGRILSMEFNETLDFNHGGYIMGDWRRLRKNAGTHLLEKCSHDIDLANWIIGSRAQRVASFGGLDFFVPENAGRIDELRPAEGEAEAYRTWDGLVALHPFTSDKDIIDNQVALLEYENGTRATFHTNCNAGIPERRMYILGAEGAIRSDVLTGTIEVKRIGFDTQVEDESTTAKGGHGGGDSLLASELVDTMLNQVPPAVGLMEGLASAVTCFAIDEAMDSGKVVDLGPYWEKVAATEPGHVTA